MRHDARYIDNTHQSTTEEIKARRAEVAAAECRGDGIHSTDLRSWHDWRLHKREPRYQVEAGADSYGYWPWVGYDEMWYCTRCRKLEERTVMLDGPKKEEA